MANILIAGCGDLGNSLARLLLADGHTVWGLRRTLSALADGVQGIALDVTQAAPWPLPTNLDYVFYTAAAGGRSDPTRYQAVYVQGLRNLLASLQQQRQTVQRVFFSSSTSVYGQNAGQWVDEDSPAAGTELGSQALQAAEQLLLNGPYPATVLRLGGIYGPGRVWLIEHARRGAQCPLEPPQWTNRIHRDDAARALQHLMYLAQPQSVYIGVDDQPTPMYEVLSWLAEQLHAPAPQPGPAPDPRRQNKRCSNRRLRESGFVLRYPSYREGYREML